MHHRGARERGMCSVWGWENGETGGGDSIHGLADRREVWGGAPGGEYLPAEGLASRPWSRFGSWSAVRIAAVTCAMDASGRSTSARGATVDIATARLGAVRRRGSRPCARPVVAISNRGAGDVSMLTVSRSTGSGERRK